LIIFKIEFSNSHGLFKTHSTEQNFKQFSEWGDEVDLCKPFRPTCQMQASMWP